MVSITEIINPAADLTTPFVYSVPINCKVENPLVAGNSLNVITFPTILSIKVDGFRTPDPDVTITSIPTNKLEASDTVIDVVAISKFAEIPVMLLGGWIPSLNSDKINSCPILLESVKSNS